MFTKMLCAVEKSYVSITTTINFITPLMTDVQKLSTLFCGSHWYEVNTWVGKTTIDLVSTHATGIQQHKWRYNEL